MGIKSFSPRSYWPSANRGGMDSGAMFRMKNILIRGEGDQSYAENYGGSRSLSETISTGAVTGTVTVVAASTAVVGSGTTFLTELHLGQFVLIYKTVLGVTTRILGVVDSITDATHFTLCRASEYSIAGATVVILPVLWEMDKFRATAVRGNAIQFDNGNILGVGSGTLKRNGSALAGTGLTLTRAPQIAILSGGNYTPYTLHLTASGAVTAAEGGAGTKGMVAGAYSFRACPARTATGGYGNPGAKINVTIVTGGNVVTFTFPSADSTHGQDAWALFGPLQAFLAQSGVQGPWYQIPTANPFNLIKVSDLTAGAISIEYNDGEIGGTTTPLLSFDNDPPPDAEYVALLAATPVYISCQGVTGSSPGPLVIPAKPSNIEAAPEELAYPTSGPETIVGFVQAQGRIYLMCVNTLQILQATQTSDPRLPPFQIRPFWRSGFKNPYSLIFVDGYLIGWTNHGLARSLADGDEGSEEFAFAVPMDEFFRDVNPGHVMLTLEPTNNAICAFYSGNAVNSDGYWTSRVWIYSLRTSSWIGDVTLSSTTGDMLVSGVSDVNGILYFLAGGIQSDNSVAVRTYQFDDITSGQSIAYYLTTQFSDDGVPERPKRVSKLIFISRQVGAVTAGIYGCEPGAKIDVAEIEAGTSGGASGSISQPANTDVTEGDQFLLNCKNLKQYAVRIAGTWSGGGVRDRIDRVIVESFVEGARR